MSDPPWDFVSSKHDRQLLFPKVVTAIKLLRHVFVGKTRDGKVNTAKERLFIYVPGVVWLLHVLQVTSYVAYVLECFYVHADSNLSN